MEARFKIGFISFEIRWWIVLLVVLSSGLAALWVPASLVPLAYLSLLLHEIGHAVAQNALFGVGSRVRLFGIIRGRTISVLPRPSTSRERIICSLSGPLVGILFGASLLAPALVFAWGWMFVAGSACIMALHLFNLLPIKDGSDGSVIKQALEKVD